MTGPSAPGGQTASLGQELGHAQGVLPGLSREDAALFLPCTKAFDHPDGPAPASQLLLITADGRDWTAKPRCTRHPADFDVALMAKVSPAMLCLVVELFWPEDGDSNHGAQPSPEPSTDDDDIELRLGGTRPGLYVNGERMESASSR